MPPLLEEVRYFSTRHFYKVLLAAGDKWFTHSSTWHTAVIYSFECYTCCQIIQQHKKDKSSTASYCVPTFRWTQVANRFRTNDSYSSSTSFLIFSSRPRFSSCESASWAPRALISIIIPWHIPTIYHSRESEWAKPGVSKHHSRGVNDPELWVCCMTPD